MLMFSDSFLEKKAMPSWTRWLCDVNPMYYILRCLYIIEWEDKSWARDLSATMTSVCDSYREYVTGTVNIPLFRSFFAGNFSVDMLDAMNCTDAVTEAVNYYKVSNFTMDDLEHLNLTQYLNVSHYAVNESAIYQYLNQRYYSLEMTPW